jgi:hypothetical protein
MHACIVLLVRACLHVCLCLSLASVCVCVCVYKSVFAGAVWEGIEGVPCWQRMCPVRGTGVLPAAEAQAVPVSLPRGVSVTKQPQIPHHNLSNTNYMI